MKKRILVDNRTIVQAIKTTASLLELHGESDFKVRSYQNAIFNLEKYPGELAQATLEDLSKVKGVGKSIADNILEMQRSGSFQLLSDLLESTPPGILDILAVKGLGAKKVIVLWKELGIETKEQLLEAIEKDNLVKLKGFGQKTQDKIKEALLQEQKNKGKLLYAQAEAFCNELIQLAEEKVPDVDLLLTGEVRRKIEIIEEIRFLVPANHEEKLRSFITDIDILVELPDSSPINWRLKTKNSEVKVSFTFCDPERLTNQLFITSANPEHLNYKNDDKTLRELAATGDFKTEEEIYNAAGLPFYIPELREGLFEFDLKKNYLDELITTKDLKGILHNHTTYSDGKNIILEMAEYCQQMGCEYFGVNDHSKSAYFYANGMYEEQVAKQQIEIDELNKKLAPFKIFKGIEVDILQDGSLDYDMETMRSFDFTVASIHSAFNMDRMKATERIIKAVSHPYTTMLGHMTGRLLLRRDGYPVDHEAVIKACAANNVIIELNANPIRLDIDWRWIRMAMDHGVMISINPDAHSQAGLHDIYYGVCAGRKAGLTKELTFNTRSAIEVAEFFKTRKEEVEKK